MTKSNDEQFADCPPELLAARWPFVEPSRWSSGEREVWVLLLLCQLQASWDSGVGRWRQRSRGSAAICPRCGIDAVIGDKSGIDVSHDFLARMNV